MVDVTSAIKAASSYFQKIDQALSNEPPENLRLEEVEKTEDERHWLVTLGYDAPSKVPYVPTLFPPRTPQPECEYSREYKLFRVNAETGDVEAMKIRKI